MTPPAQRFLQSMNKSFCSWSECLFFSSRKLSNWQLTCDSVAQLPDQCSWCLDTEWSTIAKALGSPNRSQLPTLEGWRWSKRREECTGGQRCTTAFFYRFWFRNGHWKLQSLVGQKHQSLTPSAPLLLSVRLPSPQPSSSTKWHRCSKRWWPSHSPDDQLRMQTHAVCRERP